MSVGGIRMLNTWLEWQVVKDPNDQDLISFDFNLVEKKISTTDAYKVSIPFLALNNLAEKYSWLQVLRNPNHRPINPFELVQFIRILEDLD